MSTAIATPQSVQVRFFVDYLTKKVVYAEAGKDFVDVLFSFLTFPLGTIVRLVSKESLVQPVTVGSLSSLYQSVDDLDDQYLWTHACKEMLLTPRNSMEDYCRCLKLNIDDTEPLRYFICENWECNRRWMPLCTFRNHRCFCGKVMDTEKFPESFNHENGFVKETASFIISDDLHVMPNVCGTIVHLLRKLGIQNTDTIGERTVYFDKLQVLDLLKLSLLSKTCLTDFIFNNKQVLCNSNPGNRNLSDFGFRNMVSSGVGCVMNLKVMVRKSNGEILFAEGEEDFVDFLFSFLTFPLGCVLHMLEGYPSLGCLNNIYESLKILSPDRYMISHDLKVKLAKPKIAPQFNLENQILPIDATSLPVFYCHSYHQWDMFWVDLTKEMVVPKHSKSHYGDCLQFNYVDPKSTSSKSSYSGEFVKGPSTYMVADDLAVTPMSSASPISYLKRLKVPVFDLEEKVIKIGMKEGLAILKASLVSTTALTNGLNQFIQSRNN